MGEKRVLRRERGKPVEYKQESTFGGVKTFGAATAGLYAADYYVGKDGLPGVVKTGLNKVSGFLGGAADKLNGAADGIGGIDQKVEDQRKADLEARRLQQQQQAAALKAKQEADKKAEEEAGWGFWTWSLIILLIVAAAAGVWYSSSVPNL